MNLSYDILSRIGKEFGESFYLLDTKQFRVNYQELLDSFRTYYNNSHIAYSYKTNYTPKLCKTINEMGGFAEIVSDMEYEIAKRVGVKPSNIYFNGPYKNAKAVEELLLDGGIVNVDSLSDLEIVKRIATENPNNILHIGIRCNFDIEDGVTSRFGFDVDGEDFHKALSIINELKNIKIQGLHSHFATRSLETWPRRVKGIAFIVNKYFKETKLDFISLGGGIFGKMADSLKAQFSVEIPTYSDYAKAVAISFNDIFSGLKEEDKPKLIIEPGSALVGDVMKFASKVFSIKNIRGKSIATLLGSIYNINPTLNKKNPPISVYHYDHNVKHYENLEFGGFTCIESDYLYRGYTGDLGESDYVVFGNVGSYSIVLKPPFILPNFSVVEIGEDGSIELIKKSETFDDLFHTFIF